VSCGTRSLLLPACLLACLACATPLPFEKLKVGMTIVQVTETFGEPSSTNIEELRQAVQLLQQENARIFERLESATDLSHPLGTAARKLEQSSTHTLGSLEGFVAELDEASGEQGVRSTWVYPHEERAWNWFGGASRIEKHKVDLLFDGNKLVSWETRLVPLTFTPSSGDPFSSKTFDPNEMSRGWQKSWDKKHHKKGHKHHHYDHDD
jgi:outer membrane protein assembly factor BamE (lipoprotein component of BamABCDE complex)